MASLLFAAYLEQLCHAMASKLGLLRLLPRQQCVQVRWWVGEEGARERQVAYPIGKGNHLKVCLCFHLQPPNALH